MWGLSFSKSIEVRFLYRQKNIGNGNVNCINTVEDQYVIINCVLKLTNNKTFRCKKKDRPFGFQEVEPPDFKTIGT
jgi:hypothetical protein